MKIFRTFKTAIRALRRNIMRAVLTTLGIIIGVAAVIAMMGIGRGTAQQIQNSMAAVGANNIMIFPGTAASGGISFGAGTSTTMTPEDCEAIQRECPAVVNAAPVVRARTTVVYGNKNWVPQYIYGTTPAFLEVRDWTKPADGEPISDRDVRNAAKVCMLGQTLVRELFGGESPVGKEVRIQSVTFRVIGVLSAKGASTMGTDQDDIVIAPWTTVKYRVTGSSAQVANQSAGSGSSSSVNTLGKLYPGQSAALYPPISETQQANSPMPVRYSNIDQIQLAAVSSDQVDSAVRQVTELLRQRHRIRKDDPEDFSVRSISELASTMTQQTETLNTLLLVVAALSLVVGGVGIMNIMLVSVTERTREIGLRMAVGAHAGDILRQFLSEAVVLCLLGGILGALLGGGAHLYIKGIDFTLFGRAISIGRHWPSEFSWLAVAVSLAVSTTVGLVFGFYPAWKASRLDPIEALRYE